MYHLSHEAKEMFIRHDCLQVHAISCVRLLLNSYLLVDSYIFSSLRLEHCAVRVQGSVMYKKFVPASLHR